MVKKRSHHRRSGDEGFPKNHPLIIEFSYFAVIVSVIVIYKAGFQTYADAGSCRWLPEGLSEEHSHSSRVQCYVHVCQISTVSFVCTETFPQCFTFMENRANALSASHMLG